jgi:hypothetical protein
MDTYRPLGARRSEGRATALAAAASARGGAAVRARAGLRAREERIGVRLLNLAVAT